MKQSQQLTQIGSAITDHEDGTDSFCEHKIETFLNDLDDLKKDVKQLHVEKERIISEIYSYRQPSVAYEDYFEVLLGDYMNAMATGEWTPQNVDPYEFDAVTDETCNFVPQYGKLKTQITQKNFEWSTGKHLVSFMYSLLEGEDCDGVVNAHNAMIQDQLHKIEDGEIDRTLAIERMQWDFRKSGANLEEFGAYQEYLTSEYEFTHQSSSEEILHIDYPSSTAHCLPKVEALREIIVAQAFKIKEINDFIKWAPDFLCESLHNDILSIIDENTPTLISTKQTIQESLIGLQLLVSSHFPSVEQLDIRLSDRFDYLTSTGKIDKARVHFSIPNSASPLQCDDQVQNEYSRLKSLIKYTRDALSYSDYIDNVTEYACENYEINLNDTAMQSHILLIEKEELKQEYLTKLYKANGRSQTFVQFKSEIKYQFDDLVDEGKIEWINSGSDVIEVQGICEGETADAVAAYSNIIHLLEECWTFTIWLEEQLWPQYDGEGCSQYESHLQVTLIELKELKVASVPLKIQAILELKNLDKRQYITQTEFVDELQKEFYQDNVPVILPDIEMPEERKDCPNSVTAGQVVVDREELAECLTFTQWMKEKLAFKYKVDVDCGQLDQKYQITLFKHRHRLDDAEIEIEGLHGQLYELLAHDEETNNKFDDRMRELFYAQLEKNLVEIVETADIEIDSICPLTESKVDLLDFRQILEETLTYQNWLSQKKREESMKIKALAESIINEHIGDLFAADEEVLGLLFSKFSNSIDNSESEIEFENRLRSEFEAANVPLVDTGISEQYISQINPQYMSDTQESLNEFILQLSETLTFKKWLTTYTEKEELVCPEDLQKTLLKHSIEAQVQIDIAYERKTALLDQLLAESDGTENAQSFQLRLEIEFNNEYVEPEETGFTLPVVYAGCHNYVQEIASILTGLIEQLGNDLAQVNWLRQQVGQSCNEIEASDQALIALNTPLLHSAFNEIQELLTNLMSADLHAEDDFYEYAQSKVETFASEFEKNEVVQIESDLDVIELPSECEGNRLYADSKVEISAESMMQIGQIGTSQELKDKYDALLTFLEWLNYELFKVCADQSDDIMALLEVSELRLTESLERKGELMEELYLHQAFDGETRTMFNVRSKSTFESLNIVPVETGLPVPFVADACQDTTYEALQKFVQFTQELSHHLTFQEWLETQITYTDTNAEEVVDLQSPLPPQVQPIKSQQTDLVCEDAIYYLEEQLSEIHFKILGSEETKAQLLNDLYQYNAQGETFEDFVLILVEEFEKESIQPEDPLLYTGVGTIVQLPEECELESRNSNIEVQEAVAYYADCLQLENWLAGLLSYRCSSIVTTIQATIDDNNGRLQAAQERKSVLLIGLYNQQNDDTESDFMFFARKREEFKAAAVPPTDVDIAIPTQFDGCDEQHLQDIQEALDSFDSFVEELGNCISFANWLESQVVSCVDDIQSIQAYIEEKRAELVTIGSNPQIILEALYPLRKNAEESFLEFVDRSSALYLKTDPESYMVPPELIVEDGCESATLEFIFEFNEIYIQLERSRLISEWLVIQLNEECISQSEAILDSINDHTARLITSRERVNELLAVLFLHQGLDGETQEVYIARATIAFESSGTSHVVTDLSAPVVAEVCMETADDSLLRFTELFDELQASLTFQQWLEVLKSYTDTQLECEDAIQAQVDQLNDVEFRIATSKQEKFVLLVDYHKHEGQGTHIDAFATDLIELFEATRIVIEDTLGYTGVGSIVQLPNGCEQEPEVTVNDIQDAVGRLADCFQHESWLADLLADSCSSIVADVDQTIESNLPRLQAAQATKQSLLVQLLVQQQTSSESDEAFFERIREEYLVQGIQLIDAGIDLQYVKDGCQYINPDEIEDAFKALTGFINQLQDCITFGNWLEGQLASCDTEIAQYDALIAERQSELTASKSAVQSVLHSLYQSEMEQGETIEEFTYRYEQLYQDTASQPFITPPHIDIESGCLSATSELATTHVSLFIEVERSKLIETWLNGEVNSECSEISTNLDALLSFFVDPLAECHIVEQTCLHDLFTFDDKETYNTVQELEVDFRLKFAVAVSQGTYTPELIPFDQLSIPDLCPLEVQQQDDLLDTVDEYEECADFKRFILGEVDIQCLERKNFFKLLLEDLNSQTVQKDEDIEALIDDLFSLNTSEFYRTDFVAKLDTEFEESNIDYYEHFVDIGPIPYSCDQGDEDELNESIHAYEDAVTYYNWLSSTMNSPCETLQQEIASDSLALNNNGIARERQQISFYAAHLFVISQQLDEMHFFQILNSELAAAGLIQVETSIDVPYIPESCGDAVLNTGKGYENVIMTYEYLLAAVKYLEEKVNGQCNKLREVWGDEILDILASQSTIDLEIEELTQGLFTLSQESDYTTFQSLLTRKIDEQNLNPIVSGMVVSGAYPPPHSCNEDTVMAGDKIQDAIEHYEESLARRSYLTQQTKNKCTETRMTLFHLMGDIMDSSVEVEQTTNAIVLGFLFPHSGLSSKEIFQGQLITQFNQADKDQFQGSSEFTLIDRPITCQAEAQVLQTYDFVSETNTEYEMALTYLNFILQKRFDKCVDQDEVLEDQLIEVAFLQAQIDLSAVSMTVDMLAQFGNENDSESLQSDLYEEFTSDASVTVIDSGIEVKDTGITGFCGGPILSKLSNLHQDLAKYEDDKTFESWLIEILPPRYCLEYEAAVQDVQQQLQLDTLDLNSVLEQSINSKYAELGITIPLSDWKVTIQDDYEIAFSIGSIQVNPTFAEPPASYCPISSQQAQYALGQDIFTFVFLEAYNTYILTL